MVRLVRCQLPLDVRLKVREKLEGGNGKGERWELQGQQRKLARERKVVPGGSGR
jgi:hypothetical protein